MAEKAQHDPQPPWFLTGVTIPEVLQSIAVGSVVTPKVWVDVEVE